MKFRWGRFNLYLLATAVMLLTACETTSPSGSGSKSGTKELASIRIHLETHADPILGSSRKITVGRENPQTFYVSGPMLGELQLEGAQLWEGQPGQYAIHLKFDREGRHMLESLSLSYRGKRLAIMSQFPEPRWVGTVRLERHIADGTLLFRPDATREEAEHIVKGLNLAVARLKKAKE
jgi:hypothetical protein